MYRHMRAYCALMFTSMYVSMSCFYMLLVVLIELLLFSYDTLSEMTKLNCTINDGYWELCKLTLLIHIHPVVCYCHIRWRIFVGISLWWNGGHLKGHSVINLWMWYIIIFRWNKNWNAGHSYGYVAMKTKTQFHFRFPRSHETAFLMAILDGCKLEDDLDLAAES